MTNIIDILSPIKRQFRWFLKHLHVGAVINMDVASSQTILYLHLKSKQCFYYTAGNTSPLITNNDIPHKSNRWWNNQDIFSFTQRVELRRKINQECLLYTSAFLSTKKLRPVSDVELFMCQIKCKWTKTKTSAHQHEIMLIKSLKPETGLKLLYKNDHS